MPKIVLTYFDFDGSRGEAARLALHIAGIPFEDRRIPRNDWAAQRDKYPFQSLPVLEVDGKKVVTQSNTINRYVGKLTGLFPNDDWQAALVDELMDAIEDITTRIAGTFALAGEVKKKTREALAAGPITRFLQQFESRLAAGGGEWFVEKRLTVADLKCYLWTRWLKSGALDHIPADIVDLQAPLLAKHLARVRITPRLRRITRRAPRRDSWSIEMTSPTKWLPIAIVSMLLAPGAFAESVEAEKQAILASSAAWKRPGIAATFAATWKASRIPTWSSSRAASSRRTGRARSITTSATTALPRRPADDCISSTSGSRCSHPTPRNSSAAISSIVRRTRRTASIRG